MSPLYSRLALAILLANSYAAAVQADTASEQRSTQLDSLLIQNQHLDAAGLAYQRLERTAGGINLIDSDESPSRRSNNLQDLLAYQPGIYARSAGNEGLRLSIRGSGINRGTGAHGSGVFVLLDGLPLSTPGGTPYELQEPLWIERIEVQRGANAFDHGSAALGGSINLISRTGRTAAPFSLQLESGSFGWRKYHVSAATSNDTSDAFVALTQAHSDGYQRHSESSSKGIMANFGYRFSPELQTRFYLRYRETEHETPGRLTRAQIDHDPRAAQLNNWRTNAHRPQPGSTWIANTTQWQIDEARRLDLGFSLHHYPMDLNESSNRVKLEYRDINLALRYSHWHPLFGLNSQSSLAWRGSFALPGSKAEEYIRISDNTPIGTKRREYEHNGDDSVLTLANELELAPNLWLSSALALIYTHREVEVSYPQGGNKLKQNNWDYAPRLGLTYQISPDLTLFGNLSRSVEAPHAWSMLWSSNEKFSTGLASGAIRQGVKLDNQTATSLELGARGNSQLGRWELAWYYSRLRHELLAVERFDSNGFSYIAESNASQTVHQGLEAGLHSQLADWGNAQLELRQSYTYSQFRYRNDPAFGDNYLPGLPAHYYQAQLSYLHNSGWYASLNTEQASRTPVDYANSFNAGSYGVFGAEIGYRSQDDQWHLWLEGRNLSNERYAATVVPGYNDRGQDMPRSSPGEGRGLFSGIRWQFF